MGKGKAWASEELLHLALSYISVSEDQGNNRVNGTNQAMDYFFKRVIVCFKEKAPADAGEGTYGERTPDATLRQWREGIKAGVRKFNKAINVALNADPSGVSEDQGNNRVNGTNQAMDAFFKRVITSFKEMAPGVGRGHRKPLSDSGEKESRLV